MRVVYDSILIGPNTLINDNPQLNIRLYDSLKDCSPLKVVFDPRGEALTSRRVDEQNILKEAPGKTLWCLEEKALAKIPKTTLKELERKTAQILLLKEKSDTSLAQQMLVELGQKKITSLLIEGGPGMWSMMLNQELSQKAHFFQAPFAWNPKESLFWSHGLERPFQLTQEAHHCLDKDFYFEGNINDVS